MDVRILTTNTLPMYLPYIIISVHCRRIRR